MKRICMMAMMPLVCFAAMACGQAKNSNDAVTQNASGQTGSPAKVYMVKDITPENLVRIYEALGREAKGKVAVKLSTGEPGGHNFLQPALIKDLVQKVNGTIVECNTAYNGRSFEGCRRAWLYSDSEGGHYGCGRRSGLTC